MERHRQTFLLPYGAQGSVPGQVDAVALGRQTQVHRRLCQAQITFRAAQELRRVTGRERHPQRLRVGQADVLGGDADQPPGHVQRVGAAFQQPGQPVERGVRLGAAHRFVQRRDQVVKVLAALVHLRQVAAKRLADRFRRDRLGQAGGDFQGAEGSPGVAVGQAGEQLQGFRLETHAAQATRVAQGTLQQAAHVGNVQRFEHQGPGARPQRRVDLETGILGGGPDQGQQPGFDVRQQGVLLGFVEAVDLV